MDDKYKFVVIGEGELEEDLHRLIKENGLEKRFLIHKQVNDIEKYYSAIDVFVMPSHFEGLPIVAIEAQSEGLPCVFSSEITKKVALSNQYCKFAKLNNIGEWVAAIEDLSGQRYEGADLVKKQGFDSIYSTGIIEDIIKDICE